MVCFEKADRPLMTAVSVVRIALLLSVMAAPAFAQNDFKSRILTAHNDLRAEVGTPPLEWSERLAEEARVWAGVLARQGRLQHDEQATDGENLWMGTADRFSLEAMIGGWSGEQADYRRGAFPDVARQGRVVGHYTQMVWRTTRQVGCALARNASDEVLVCRYFPAGNWIGQAAY